MSAPLPVDSQEVQPAAESRSDAETAAPSSASARRLRLYWGAGVVLFLAGVIALAVAAETVAIPLLAGFIIAYLLDPIVDRFEARGIDRTPAIAIILGAFSLVLTVFGLLVIPQLGRELAEAPAKLRDALAQLLPWAEATVGLDVPRNVEAVVAELQRQLDGVKVDAIAAPLSTLMKAAAGGTLLALAKFATLVMIPVFAFYLLRDFDLIIARARDLIPHRFRPAIGARFAEIDVAMGSFIRGQLTVAAILAVLYTAGLWAVGLPLALAVGVIAGFGNLVPYLGTALGLVLATAMAILDWHGFGHLALVYTVFIVVQGIEGWVITPKVVGESVGLSPFVVIVAVLAFGDLFGFVGVLLAVPLAAILKILLRVALEAYESSDFYTHDARGGVPVTDARASPVAVGKEGVHHLPP